MLKATVGVLALLLLAGCTASNSANGQEATAAGSLMYNGASNGSHSHTFQSDGSCTLHLSANLGSGRLTVTMTTSDGTTVQGGATGPGQTNDVVGDARGTPGSWTLRADRSSNSNGPFTGQYVLHAEC